MTAILTVHDIGRASDPAATVRTEHADADEAMAALIARHGVDNVRGRDGSGTIGSLTGRVFQASKTWSIR